MGNDKQLVIFLDFWGFKKYYEFISRQRKPESQEYLFKAFFGLYHGYINRIRGALASLPQVIKEQQNDAISDFAKNTQVLAISDSIVITIDCTDQNIGVTFIFACFLLSSAIDESVKTETHIEDFKKFGYLFYLPIRGGISYGYSITNLKSAPPFLFSCAYNDAVALEKQAGWPRILIDEHLAQTVKSNPITDLAISEDGSDIFFDPLKFKYQLFLNNPKINFQNKAGRIDFLEKAVLPYKSHIEMCAKEAGIFYKHYIDSYHSDEDCPIDPQKYKRWIAYYNDRIKWLVANDKDFSERKDLLISDDLWATNFRFPSKGSNDYHTICILPWINFEKTYEANGIQILPFPGDGFDADFQSAMREVLRSYKDVRGKTLTACTVLANSSRSPKWSLTEEDHGKIGQASSLFFLASMACNQYFTQHSTYSNSSAFQPIFQNLSIPPRGFAVEHRRRDGRSLDGGYQHGDIKFSCPLECKSLNPEIDEKFLKTLHKASEANDNLYRRLLVSLSFFKLANTDQSHMSLDAEVVQLAAAFEILFDSEGAYYLSCKYGEIFDNFKEVTVETAIAERSGITLRTGYESEHKQWQLGRKFIEELHQLRSAIVHGEDRTKRTWGWNNFEHLIIGAYVYPIAVKLLLEKAGHYTLSESDQIVCRSIDIILSKTNWADPVNEQSNHSIWQEGLSEAGHEFRSKKIARLLEESRFFGKNETAGQ